MNYKLIKSLVTAFCCFLSLTAYADVYEFIDEAGNTHLSDAPADERYALILKTELPIAETATDNTRTNLLSTKSYTLPITSPLLLAQIEQSALNNQLDSELIHAVMHVESAFKIQAKSNKGAQGLMQLMPATASRMGVTNRYDPAQSIEGGAKYLRQLLTLFNNDVTLAVAAYNAGENAVIKYGNHIPPYKETQAYVPKVLSIYRALLMQRQQLM